jgi:hypothetical protein
LILFNFSRDGQNRTRFFSKILRILLSFRICNWFVRTTFNSGDILLFMINYVDTQKVKNMKFSNFFNIVMRYINRRVLVLRLIICMCFWCEMSISGVIGLFRVILRVSKFYGENEHRKFINFLKIIWKLLIFGETAIVLL